MWGLGLLTKNTESIFSLVLISHGVLGKEGKGEPPLELGLVSWATCLLSPCHSLFPGECVCMWGYRNQIPSWTRANNCSLPCRPLWVPVSNQWHGHSHLWPPCRQPRGAPNWAVPRENCNLPGPAVVISCVAVYFPGHPCVTVLVPTTWWLDRSPLGCIHIYCRSLNTTHSW